MDRQWFAGKLAARNRGRPIRVGQPAGQESLPGSAHMEALIPIIMFLSIAAVMILRPLTKKLGLVIEQVARDRQGNRADQVEVEKLRAEIEHLGRRLQLVEERADFTERLVGVSRRVQNAQDSVAVPRPPQVPWDDRPHSYLR